MTKNPAAHDRARARVDKALGGRMIRRCARDRLAHMVEAFCNDRTWTG